MKKSLLLIILFLLCGVSGVLGQDAEETVRVPVSETIFSDGSATGWPQGDQSDGTTTIGRSFSSDGYLWQITSESNQYTAAENSALYIPDEYRVRIEAQILLPYYEPSVCAGITFNLDESAFEVFMVCNDQTYGFYKNSAGSWTAKIPFSKILNFNQGESIPMRIDISNGWADFYLWDELLDTAQMDWQAGSIGLFAQPLSSQETPVTFQTLEISLAQEKSVESGFADNTPADVARLIRMLELKGRVENISGSYSDVADLDTSLAQMGYFLNHPLGYAVQDFLLQSDISWKSAYSQPNNTDSGCGFTFRSRDDNLFLQVFAALDGNIYLSATRNGVEIPLATYSYRPWSLEGSGTLAVAASGSKISVLYDQQLLGTITDATWKASGDLGRTVFSGTNYDYGISCAFTNTQLYIFDEG